MLQVATPGPLPELTSLSTGDYLESWLSQARGRVRGRTYCGYAGLLRRYAIPVLGQVPLKDLHPLHLQHLYGQLLEQGAGGYRDRLSASTVLNCHRVLVQSLGWAERFGLVERSPAKAARPPRPRRAEPPIRTHREGPNLRADWWTRAGSLVQRPDDHPDDLTPNWRGPQSKCGKVSISAASRTWRCNGDGHLSGFETAALGRTRRPHRDRFY